MKNIICGIAIVIFMAYMVIENSFPNKKINKGTILQKQHQKSKLSLAGRTPISTPERYIFFVSDSGTFYQVETTKDIYLLLKPGDVITFWSFSSKITGNLKKSTMVYPF